MANAQAIEIRDLKFGLGSGIDVHWHGRGRAVSIFFDNLSLFFPAGERFFVEAVGVHARRIEDPKLREDVRGFIGQEAMHRREHIAYNAMLERNGYPARAMEGRVERLLKLVRRVMPARARLAITCALEHFTALLAHFVLEDERLLEGADPTMARLWQWHALEESEHKAVAYDVYQAVGGGYLLRSAIMVATTAVFWAKVFEQQVRMMAADGCLWSPRQWWSLARFLFVEPGGMFRLARLYLGWFRPGFHPDDFDTEPLLRRWRARLQPAAAEG